MKIDSLKTNVGFSGCSHRDFVTEKANLNAPLNDSFTVRNTPGRIQEVVPPPTLQELTAKVPFTKEMAKEYAGFKTTNPAIRFLKAVSKVLFR